MLESACNFGDDCQLTGVYTRAKNHDADNPCLLFLTAGLLHHVGPTRLHVEMARAFASNDVSGLRFDLSGVGDSESSTLGGQFEERSVHEVRQAMSFLQAQYGHKAFVLVGLCSGADDALATAAQDQRVAGLVLLNGYAYRAGFFRLFRILKFYLPRLFMPEKIKARCQRLARRLLGASDPLIAADQKAVDALDSDYRYVPPKQDTEAVLCRLEEEHVDMLLVYTGSEHDDYTYQGQVFAMFPQLRHSKHVREYYAQMADHTFVLASDRQALIGQVQDWYEQAQLMRDEKSAMEIK